jgi:hypothetical protein
MPTEVTVHPTAKIALIAVVIAVVIAVAAGSGLVGLKRLFSSSDPAAPESPSLSSTSTGIDTLSEFLLPVVRVPVEQEAPESDWSEALAAVLSGRTEVPTEHGRVDVLTERFAIEVDRMSKWHEAIGQASHYSGTTQKRPAIALIVLPSDSLQKLELIDETCTSKGISLVILQTTKAQPQNAAPNP